MKTLRCLLVASQALAFSAAPALISGGCSNGAGEASKYPPGQSPDELEAARQLREFDTQKKTGMSSADNDLLQQMRNFDKKKNR